MRVLSLFDGMSCGYQALKNLNVTVDEYHAFEIDKHAITIAKKNHPDIIHHGSVVGADFTQFEGFDLVIGGFPCQSYSFSGKQKGFEDARGMLFYDMLRAIKESRPKYFMCENVKMKKEFETVITNELGVDSICINSNLVSAQNRKRLYWTNIPNITQPEDKGILLKDIVHEHTDLSPVKVTDRIIKEFKKSLGGKSNCLSATSYKGAGNNGMPLVMESLAEYIVPFDKTLEILDKEVERGKVGYFRKDSQANRVYYIHDKAVTLCDDAGGGAAKMGQYLFGNKTLVPIENHNSRDGIKCVAGIEVDGKKRLDDGKVLSRNFSQGNRVHSIDGKAPTMTSQPKGGTAGNSDLVLFGCISPDRVNKRQNGQRFNDGRKFYTLTAQDKHGVLVEGYIRKLTPVECERLQTVPDGYTEGVSNSQRYKMLGNGWTVAVIEHIFKNIL